MAEDWFESGGSGHAADVGALLDGQGVLDALVEIVELGALVSVGVTSDGGAMGVTVTFDERRKREYFRDVEDLQTWLSEARPAVRLAAERRAASPAPRSRQRRS